MLPIYLFSDPGFWLFSLIYTAGVAIGTALLVWPIRQLSQRPRVNRAVPISIAILFVVVLIYQFFHQAEHVTQMYQFRFLGFSAQEAHGIVWFLDDEWNHFVFNLGYTIFVTVLFAFLFRALHKTRTPWKISHVGYMLAFLVLEGWHLVEHTYRIIHHVQGLCDQCPGIIDTAFDINRLVLHFWLNFFALILPAAVFVWYRIPEQIFLWRRQRAAVR